MLRVRSCEDLDECAGIWEKAWPKHCIFDLWEVRACFASCFGNEPYFLIAEEGQKIEGVLALSWIDESQSYGHFPGETWRAKTWLEQNKTPARSSQALKAMLECVPGPLHLRYLTPDNMPGWSFPLAMDEVGYLFIPGKYGYSFDNYMLEFSGKSRKNLGREIAKLQSGGVSYRYNHLPDIDWLFQKNMQSFGELSYFSDARFRSSYEQLVKWLSDHDFLRITTVLLGGRVAAVDIGTVWGREYTVLAGATDLEFQGVAKVINLHHMQWACRQRLNTLDFLCGDFGWKKRFHLTPRPLYEIYRNCAAKSPAISESRLSRVKVREH